MGHMRLRIWLQDAIHRGNNSNSEVILFPLFLDIGQNVTVLGVHANDKKMSSSWEEYIYFDGGFGFIGIGVRNRSRRNPLLMPIISVYFFYMIFKKTSQSGRKACHFHYTVWYFTYASLATACIIARYKVLSFSIFSKASIVRSCSTIDSSYLAIVVCSK